MKNAPAKAEADEIQKNGRGRGFEFVIFAHPDWINMEKSGKSVFITIRFSRHLRLWLRQDVCGVHRPSEVRIPNA